MQKYLPRHNCDRGCFTIAILSPKKNTYSLPFSQKMPSPNAHRIPATIGPIASHIRCSFTGKERDAETGYSYFGSRYLDNELIPSWLSVDPMADKYPGISPYAYCAWNPVKLVDPNGEDVWELNRSGELIWKEASDQDVIKARNGKSVKVKDGVLQKGESYTKDNKFMCLNFGNDSKNATTVFEFMADNTKDIEFSLLGYSSSIDTEKPSDFIVGTSYSAKGDHWSSKGAENFARKGLLRLFYHNHPNGNAAPSNILNNGSLYKTVMPGNDISSAEGIDMLMEMAGCAYKCNFAIYVSRGRGKYKPFHTRNNTEFHSQVNKQGRYYSF